MRNSANHRVVRNAVAVQEELSGWIPGTLGDLVARARGRPIYCTAPPTVHPALMAAVVDSLGRECPSAKFVTDRLLFWNVDDRRRRWRAEVERHGAGIIVTRGDHPQNADPFAGLAGEHVIGIYPEMEIADLVHLGRPVGWYAVVFPASYWFSRFAVEPFSEIQTSRYARLLPAPDAEPFCPAIGRWPFIDAGGA